LVGIEGLYSADVFGQLFNRILVFPVAVGELFMGHCGLLATTRCSLSSSNFPVWLFGVLAFFLFPSHSYSLID